MKVMHGQKKRDDRRSNRTRRALREALVELILEKRYDAITVQNVLDRANVGRSTFYAHYRDKEDLFLSDWEELLDWFVRHIKWENISEGRVIPVRELFTHVKEFHHFYVALVRSRKTNWLFKTGLNFLSNRIESALTSLPADYKLRPSVPFPLLSNYIASEILALLRWWLAHDLQYSPERMDEIFHELVMPSLRSLIMRDETGAYALSEKQAEVK